MLHGTSPNRSPGLRMVQYIKACSRAIVYDSSEQGKERLRRRSLRLLKVLGPMIDKGEITLSLLGEKLFATDIIRTDAE